MIRLHRDSQLVERVSTYRIKLHNPTSPLPESSMADSNVKGTKGTKRRASTPRSKKGCITCKIRRLKCGEEKPGCLRCSKSGWTCDGYEHHAVSSSSQASQSASSATLHPILPQSSSSRSARSSVSARSIESRSRSPSMAPLSRAPSFNLQVPPQLDFQEQQYFQVFLEENRNPLTYVEPLFWKNVAVQESHITTSVRHAIVALGALIKSCSKSASGNYLVNDSRGLHRDFALDQHEKSIRGLRECIGSSGAGSATRSIVLSCLVLARLEPFIGNGGFAMQHIRYARQIIFSPTYKEPNVPSMFPNWNDPNDVTLYMFYQSDHQALAAFGSEEDWSIADRSLEAQGHSIPISVPAVFKDMEEAQEYSHIVCQEARMFWYRSTIKNDVAWSSSTTQSTLDLRDFHIRQLHFLLAALDVIAIDNPEDSTSHPLRRSSSIKLQAVSHLIQLSLALNSPESGVDNFLEYFGYIVAVCRRVVAYEQLNGASTGNHTYAFERRIIPPLFLVASKCRDGELRRQAISLLLSSHRQELLWDSIVMGNVGYWIMSLEEEGKDINGYISDSNRAWGHSMELDLRKKVHLVKCRLGPKIPGQWIERTTEIPCNEILT